MNVIPIYWLSPRERRLLRKLKQEPWIFLQDLSAKEAEMLKTLVSLEFADVYLSGKKVPYNIHNAFEPIDKLYAVFRDDTYNEACKREYKIQHCKRIFKSALFFILGILLSKLTRFLIGLL